MTRGMLLAAAAAISLGLSANNATAHSALGEAKKPLAHRETHSAAHEQRVAHHRTIAHRFVRGTPAYGAPFYVAPPGVAVYHGPGYTYVPRKGIVDEACNLPTSACPNELRDIQ